MALTTVNITGNLSDVLGGDALDQALEVSWRPHATHQALSAGGDAYLGGLDFPLWDLPNPWPVPTGPGVITVRRRSAAAMASSTGATAAGFRTITYAVDLTVDTSWGDIIAGSVSSPPMTPTLVQQAQEAATEAEAAATTATAAAAELATVEATNDGIMTAVAEDDGSSFSQALTATIETATETMQERRNRQRRENPPRWVQDEDGLTALTRTGLTESGGRINATTPGTNGDAILPMWGAAKDFRASFIVKATKSIAGSRGGVGFVVSPEGALPTGTGPTTAGTYVAGYLQGTGIAVVRDNITTPFIVVADASLVDGDEYRVTVTLNDRANRATGEAQGTFDTQVYNVTTGALVNRASVGYTIAFYTPRNVLIRTNQAEGPRDIEISQHIAGASFATPSYFAMVTDTTDGVPEPAFLRVPANPNGKIVLALHGHGASTTTTAWVDGALTPTWEALEQAGYTIAVPDMGGNLWGNDLALARTVDLFNQMTTYFDLDPNNVYLWGTSMGGGAAASIIAKRLLPVRAAYLAQPAVDYDTIRANPSYSTIIDAYPTVAEQDDNNPLKQPGASYAGVPLMIVASSGDTAIAKAGNADALAALASPHTLVRQITATGNHNDVSHYRAIDTLNWFRSNA